jgi:hypothetical protein
MIGEPLAGLAQLDLVHDRSKKCVHGREARAGHALGFAALRQQCSMSCGVGIRVARIDALWSEGLERFGAAIMKGKSGRRARHWADARGDVCSRSRMYTHHGENLREPLGEGAGAQLVDRLGLVPVSIARWSKDSSSVMFVELRPLLWLVASRGPGHPESRGFYETYAPTTCAHEGSVIFWDLGGLLSTDIGVVGICLGVGKTYRKNIAQLHMYYASPLIGMAVTVGNVALGGLIDFYRQPEPFVEALARACAPGSA